MKEHDCLLTVQIMEDGFKQRIPGPFVIVTGQQADAVRFERSERVSRLLETAFGIG